MTKYTKRILKKTDGTAYNRYWVGTRLSSEKNIPPEILDKLQDGVEYDTDPPPPPKEDTWYRRCVFCGMGSTWYRTINGRTIYICETHYYDKNIGQTLHAAVLKEAQERQSNEGEEPSQQRAEETETVQAAQSS